MGYTSRWYKLGLILTVLSGRKPSLQADIDIADSYNCTNRYRRSLQPVLSPRYLQFLDDVLIWTGLSYHSPTTVLLSFGFLHLVSIQMGESTLLYISICYSSGTFRIGNMVSVVLLLLICWRFRLWFRLRIRWLTRLVPKGNCEGPLWGLALLGELCTTVVSVYLG